MILTWAGRQGVHRKPCANSLNRSCRRWGAKVIDRLAADLRRLADLRPDLWLPAFPAEAQNANLYDHDWEEVLVENRRLFPAAPSPAPRDRQRPE